MSKGCGYAHSTDPVTFSIIIRPLPDFNMFTRAMGERGWWIEAAAG